jgi:uncharacterized protein YggT (Ycf19 family)
MSLIDLILNLAGLMLWLGWRSSAGNEAATGVPGGLLSTLRRANPRERGWVKLAGLILLLAVRGLFYKQVGSEVDWTPSLPLGPILLSFRTDLWDRVFLFSLLSFVLSLGIFYSSLLLLSVVNHRMVETSPQQRWVRARLGRFESWPRWVKVLLPWLALTLLWLVLSPLLARMRIIPPPVSPAHLAEQAAVIGLGSYFGWKYVIAAILAFHIVSSYVYLGNAPFWTFINSTSRTLNKPLSFLPLQTGKFDFSPVLLMVLVFALSELAARGLLHLYIRLPILPAAP